MFISIGGLTEIFLKQILYIIQTILIEVNNNWKKVIFVRTNLWQTKIIFCDNLLQKL